MATVVHTPCPAGYLIDKKGLLSWRCSADEAYRQQVTTLGKSFKSRPSVLFPAYYCTTMQSKYHPYTLWQATMPSCNVIGWHICKWMNHPSHRPRLVSRKKPIGLGYIRCAKTNAQERPCAEGRWLSAEEKKADSVLYATRNDMDKVSSLVLYTFHFWT